MTRTLTGTLLLASLALASPASAAQIDISTYGHGNHIQADGFGNANAGLRVEGHGNDVDFFAGPCVGDGRSQTILRGSSQRRVMVAPCL